MSLCASIGVGKAIDGYSAAKQAAHQALDELGNSSAALAIVFASQEFDIQNVLAGVSSLLGNTPQWGFSTTAPLVKEGQCLHAVVVALLSGEDLKVQVQWIQDYAQDSAGAAQKLTNALPNDPWVRQAILLAVDGILGDSSQFCQALEEASANHFPKLAGCLAGGDFHLGKTYQIGGSQSGSGGLSSAYLSGKICLGSGMGHGWLPAGPYFHVSRSSGVWIRSFDGKPAAERLSDFFGIPARDWAFPPLTDLARLYPLAFERPGLSERIIRSPLHVEADGSLRMHLPVAEGSVGHLLVGSPDDCLQAAREAAKNALAEMGTARPFFGLVFADVAWQMLFTAQPGAEIAAIREILGPDLPLAGAYTLGQFAEHPLRILNQQIVIALFGETED